MHVFKVLALLLGIVSAAQDLGYPAGLMGDCPGMNKNTTLSEKTRNSLVVVLRRPPYRLYNNDQKTCKLSAEGAECTKKYFVNFSKRKTQVLISGYFDATFSPLGQGMVIPYLGIDRNIIMVELFPVLVRTYPLAARLTRPLGKLLGEYLAELTRLGLSNDDLEFTGGSLGAHIAAYAAYRYWELTGLKPARITALDPAGPCFRNLSPSERLSPSAAQRVDALHTNIDGFGIADTVAHIDFYANGGEYQPLLISDFILPCFLFCSHVRAAIYWIQSFKDPEEGFTAVKCDSIADARLGNCFKSPMVTNVLGLNTNFSQPGIYYLPTNEASPYYRGRNGLKQLKYRFNNYLLKAAPDEDVVL